MDVAFRHLLTHPRVAQVRSDIVRRKLTDERGVALP